MYLNEGGNLFCVSVVQSPFYVTCTDVQTGQTLPLSAKKLSAPNSFSKTLARRSLFCSYDNARKFCYFSRLLTKELVSQSSKKVPARDTQLIKTQLSRLRLTSRLVITEKCDICNCWLHIFSLI